MRIQKYYFEIRFIVVVGVILFFSFYLSNNALFSLFIMLTIFQQILAQKKAYNNTEMPFQKEEEKHDKKITHMS